MKKSFLILPALLLGCASASSKDLVSMPTPTSSAPGDSALETETLLEGSSSSSYEYAPYEPSSTLFAPAPVATTFEPVPLAGDLHKSRWTIKGGYYSVEDADELDDGFIVNLSWMRYFTRIFALELEAGYFDADGSSGGIPGDVTGIPLMLNGRLNLPVWILDLYGGLGLGAIYYDIEIGNAQDDGFVAAGNVFLGASLGLFDIAALGLEAKYYVTDDTDLGNNSLDAFALLLTLGF